MSIGKRAIGGTASTRSVVGELIGLTGPGGAIGGGILVGKMRIRASSLAPGRLHTVDLPIQGERQQSKAAQCTGHATVSLWLELGSEGSSVVSSLCTPPCAPASPPPPPPSFLQKMRVSWPSRLAAAYLADPQPWPPVLLLAMGCSPGDDIRSPHLGNEELEYDVDKVLLRRSMRVVIGALEQVCIYNCLYSYFLSLNPWLTLLMRLGTFVTLFVLSNDACRGTTPGFLAGLP